MPRKRKHLSHEEIWDDSALLDSWDAALQEYQLYHSIHARGERVEDVLKQAVDAGQVTMDSPPDTGNTGSVAINGMAHSEELEDGEVEDEQVADDTLLDVDTKKDAAKTNEIHLNRNQRHSPALAESEGSQNFPQPSAVPSMLVNGGGLQSMLLSVLEEACLQFS
ncbi:MAG: hypothetical protein Q9182_003644 [Xanthomendoza sp. 2 TL-2023]